MRLVTRVDTDTGETLMSCGGEDFNLIQAQKQLRNAGMVMQEVREDRWAIVVPFFARTDQATEEAPNGR